MYTFPPDSNNIPTSGTCVIAGQGVYIYIYYNEMSV